MGGDQHLANELSNAEKPCRATLRLGNYAEIDVQVQEIILAMYETCFDFRSWPQASNFVAC